jgi:hypothetical protein
MIFVENMEIIMDFQIPLLVIYRGSVSIIHAHSRTRRVTHLILIGASIETDNGELNFFRSFGWDPGHHEEFWNGEENNIIIKEVNLRAVEKFENLLV